MRFQKASGLTASEKLLADLCEKSFLSLWSYPNVFRKPGKELCDLLVVFGSSVVIFSDKSCSYPDTGRPELDWNRWFRRSVVDSATQIFKAENWIRRAPDRAFLDAKCTQRLPIDLPQSSKIYRVCVALGASERAQVDNGKRDLVVSATVDGNAPRFTIGKVQGKVIHVFNEDTLPIILTELSTCADFLDYLQKKEELFASGQFKFAESELDLLAYFLWNGRKFPNPGGKRFFLDPNLWSKVEADKSFLAAREENKVSYFWDGLIEYLVGHYMQRTLETGNDMEVSDYERVVRFMAGEDRFSRRLLSKWVLERAEMAKNGYVSSLFPSPQADVLYTLLVGPGDGGKDHAQYRKDRMSQLSARCHAAKAAVPDRRFVVGFALDARGVKGSSEDFMFMDTATWTPEVLAAAEKLRQDLGYFVDGQAKQTQISEAEYPGP